MKIKWITYRTHWGASTERGLVGNLCLFTYHWGYTLTEDKEHPYILNIFCGQKEKNYRYATEEECKKQAEKFLKYLKEQLK